MTGFESPTMTARAVALLVLALLAFGVEASGAQTVRWSLGTNATTVSLDLSEEGAFVVEGRQSTLLLYDRSGELVWGKNIGAVSEVALSPGAERIAVASDGKVLLFDREGRLLWQYGESGAQFVSLDVSRDRVAAGTSGGRLVALDFSGRPLWSRPLCSGVKSVSFAPDGRSLAVAAANCVYLFDADGNELLARNRSAEVVEAAALGSRLAFALRDGDLESVAVDGPSWRLPIGTAAAALSSGAAGQLLLASGWDLHLVLPSGEVNARWTSPIRGQTGPIEDAALSPDGSVLAFVGSGNMTLWENLPPPPAASPSPSPSPTVAVERVFVCPDGTEVANRSLCPSPTPSSPTPSPAPESPPPPSPPAGAGFQLPSIPVVPIAAAAAAAVAVLFAIGIVRKHRDEIDRWRLQRRMRRI